MAMHPHHSYREDCPGCQLKLLPMDGKPVPERIERIAMREWWASPVDERSACQRVWVHNSRDPHDLELMGAVMQRIQDACATVDPEAN